MPAKCAYCDRNEKPTREHLFPRSIVTASELDPINLVPRLAKFIPGDGGVIRDVCGVCNNEHLSALDDYAGTVFRDRLAAFVTSPAPLALSIDWHIFVRWLFKVAFNFARAHSHPGVAEPYRAYRQFMLFGESAPPFRAYVQVVLPAPIPPDTSMRIAEKFRKLGYLPPHILRNGRIASPSFGEAFHDVRLVGLHSYLFYLVVPRPDVGRAILRRSYRALEHAADRWVRLPAAHGQVVVTPARTNWLQAYAPTIGTNLDIFEREFHERSSRSETP